MHSLFFSITTKQQRHYFQVRQSSFSLIVPPSLPPVHPSRIEILTESEFPKIKYGSSSQINHKKNVIIYKKYEIKVNHFFKWIGLQFESSRFASYHFLLPHIVYPWHCACFLVAIALINKYNSLVCINPVHIFHCLKAQGYCVCCRTISALFFWLHLMLLAISASKGVTRKFVTLNDVVTLVLKITMQSHVFHWHMYSVWGNDDKIYLRMYL